MPTLTSFFGVSMLLRTVAAALCCMCALAGFGGSAYANSSLRIVALGDSYSAGVGLGPVTAGCDRNPGAYSWFARKNLLPRSHSSVLMTAWPACSGNKIFDVLSGQLGAVNSSHNVATITIGGNDIGFAPKIGGCIAGRCGPDTFGLQADVPGGSNTWDSLYQNLVTTYIQIRRRMAADGHLYVLTYPIPFARQTNAACGTWFDVDEQNAGDALVVRLDDTIYWAVQKANELLPSVHGRPGNVHFVDWRVGARINDGYMIPNGYPGAGQTFPTWVSGNGLCNAENRKPLINGVAASLRDYKNSLHPNAFGYAVAAVRLTTAINTFQP